MNYKRSELTTMTPREFREIVRRGQWAERTELVACLGYAQANLAVVPKDYAFDFLLFCNRNPRACPVMDVTDPGDPRPKLAAPDADLRTDLPKYRVYTDGKIVDEPTDVTNYWRDDLVAFLIGCSAGIDEALLANVHYRILGVYTTTINLRSGWTPSRAYGCNVPPCQWHPRCCPDYSDFVTASPGARATRALWRPN